MHVLDQNNVSILQGFTHNNEFKMSNDMDGWEG